MAGLALVTGGSRGIGAATARHLAAAGWAVVLTFRDKARRAAGVVDAIAAAGGRARAVRADLTDRAASEALFHDVAGEGRPLGVLVLNASGGLERGRPASYAHDLNVTAQVRALDLALPLMARRGRVVFVTSHYAHFYGQRPVHPGYEVVAASKRAGEDALRARSADLAAAGVGLVVVSGDLVEGTITPRLLERASPGLIAARRAQAGSLPGVDDFGAAILRAATDPTVASGDTVYVGATA